MLKVMIVDDEFYFREALKVSICWEKHGFTICGEAKNGKDAIEKIDLLNPDIIIVDINMPIMDGFQLVKNLKDKGIESKVIIISGHSEFNYAKQAVEIGAYNYILKPVNEEELVNTLYDVKKVIEKERNIQIEIDRLKRQLKDKVYMKKNKLLDKLLQGTLNKNEYETLKRNKHLNNNIDSNYYVVATIELNNEKDQDSDNKDWQKYGLSISNIINEILSKNFNNDIYYDSYDRICIVIGSKNVENECSFRQLLENELRDLRMSVYRQLNFYISIGVGSIKRSLFDISESYKESLIALKSKLIIGQNKIISYETFLDSEVDLNIFSTEYRNQLLINLRIGDEKEVQNLIDHLFKEIRKKNIHYGILLMICIKMVSVCLEFIGEIGLNFMKILPNYHNHLYLIEEIESKESVDEIQRWIEGIYNNVLDAAKKTRPSNAENLVKKVKKYINQNYHNSELSIHEISKNLFVNYAHLCFIFKRETGMTINNYLTQLRMNKAKELFDSGNVVVHYVANKVGYADANYFGKCFKKYYGVAPSKYIENIRK